MIEFLRGDIQNIEQRARLIKAIALDVDGVLTRGDITYDDRGRELKSFNVLDGHRIKVAMKFGLAVFIITGRSSAVVDLRARELTITGVYQGAMKKGIVFEQLLAEQNVTAERVAFLGDDIIDIPALRRAGLAGMVANAHEHLACYCHVRTNRRGGEGAVADFIEFILDCQGYWSQLITDYEKE